MRINQELSCNNGTTEKSLQNETFTRVTVKAVYLIDINNYVNDLGMVRLIFISQKYAYVSSRTVFLKLKDTTRKKLRVTVPLSHGGGCKSKNTLTIVAHFPGFALKLGVLDSFIFKIVVLVSLLCTDQRDTPLES